MATSWLMVAMLLGGSDNALQGEAFWNVLEPLCGQAFEGKMTEGTEPSDAAIGDQQLVMHVRECSETEIRIPFHVGDDRSRTWILTRSAEGVRLKHDHRHEDGSEDDITQYGGDTQGAVEGAEDRTSLDFHADEHTANIVPAAKTNIWTMAVEPAATFTYGLRREEQNRRFRVEFDLANPVEAPPAPWGHE